MRNETQLFAFVFIRTFQGDSPMVCKIPLILTPQPEGGYTITSPLLTELITEGDSLDEVLENVKDALVAVIEIYEDLNYD